MDSSGGIERRREMFTKICEFSFTSFTHYGLIIDDRRKSKSGQRRWLWPYCLRPAKQAHIVPLLLLSRSVALVLFALKKYEVEWSLSCLQGGGEVGVGATVLSKKAVNIKLVPQNHLRKYLKWLVRYILSISIRLYVKIDQVS